MSVVASFDYLNRRIYMAVASFHPIDIYREARIGRATNEMHRCCRPMVSYSGNVAKGGGKFTPRYMTMLDGAKIVPVDGSIEPVTTITGEIITDDQTEFIDVAPLTVNPMIRYQPPEAEVIEVITSGGDPEAIAAAVWENAVRTLTSAGAGGATAQEVWEYVTRELTAGSTPPTVQQIRQEIDANSTRLSGIAAAIDGVPDAVIDRKDEIVQAADTQMFHVHQCDGMSMHELLQVLTSTLFGKVSISGDIVTFRNTPDTKNRVVAVVNAQGERLSVTLDLSD